MSFQRGISIALALLFLVSPFMFVHHAGAADKDTKAGKAAAAGGKNAPAGKSDAKAEKAPAPGGKVAVVNGKEITQAEFDKEFSRIQRQMGLAGGAPPADTPETRKRVLDNLVSRELLLQESEKQGMKVEQKEVDERIAALKAKFGDEAQFADAIEKMGMTEADLKERVAGDMGIAKLLDQEVMSKVTVTDEEARAFFDGNPELFKVPERVRASHILITVKPEAGAEEKAEARKKIEDVQKRIKNGEDFAAVAKESSQCPSSARGGDLDYFQRGQMVKPFEDAAFALKPGEVSDIVETQFGYHIIKVTDRKEAGTVSYEEAAERIKGHLKNQKTEEQVALYIEKLRSNAKVETFLE